MIFCPAAGGTLDLRSRTVEQANDTIPLSDPSWTWDMPGATEAETDTGGTAVAERPAVPTIAAWAELPSRRWLIEAIRAG